METWTVYILTCADGNTYTGCTNNFGRRLLKHQAGEVLSTRSKRPVSVLLKITFYDKYKAFAFEKYLKLGSGPAFSNRHFRDNSH
ncbi:MAG TPA: GIY-YIG nuclease family protein [Chryseolinea sp.]|nr:GIY-YIG nuclease family protein [Chryseolinea sp.]